MGSHGCCALSGCATLENTGLGNYCFSSEWGAGGVEVGRTYKFFLKENSRNGLNKQQSGPCILGLSRM